MKTCLRLFWVFFALLTVVQFADAQEPWNGNFYDGEAFQPISGDLRVGAPGRIWVGANWAEQGLGYEGSYLTLGAKSRLWTDALDGRWLGEFRGHYAVDEGGFFGNIGLERVFSIHAAGADVSFGAWFDYDGDEQGLFSHTHTAMGISGSVKTRSWDLIGNGYFPNGTSDYTTTGPDGLDCFFQNHIVLNPGIDSALKGFDATLNLRPQRLCMVNGTIGFGAYGYGSDLVEYFGGGRIRASMQILQGMIVTAEVNHDDRFDTTGVVGMSWLFGAHARGNEYAGIGRDLERTIRNDHIVRYRRDVELAINPATGAAYNVFHVDNTADPAVADGSIDRRFRELKDAEAASAANDVVFVHFGDGTARFQDEGIILKDGQFLLGAGVQHVIPVQNGQNFVLCNPLDGNRPTISGSLRNPAVELASGNTVRGFIIDGTAGTGGMSVGIEGLGAPGSPLTGGTIEDNMISGAILHGIHLNEIAGDWTVSRNDASNNGVDGAFIENACDPNSTFVFEDNTFNGNGFDGLHLENYDAESILIRRNTTDGNGRDGVRLTNFKGTDADIEITNHSATGNGGRGIHIDGGEGDISIINPNLTQNAGGGVRVANWQTPDPTQRVFIGSNVNGTSNISNNGAGIGIDVELNSGRQLLIVSDVTADFNLTGLQLQTDGLGTFLDARITDNLSFSNNIADGIRAIATGGSTQNILIEQPNAPPPIGVLLPITLNGSAGINLQAGIDNSGLTSVINANISQVLLGGNAIGYQASSIRDGQITSLLTESQFLSNGTAASINVNNNNAGNVNTFEFQNVTADNNGSGFDVLTEGGSLTNFIVANSVITATLSDYNPGGGTPQPGPQFTDSNAGPGQGIGINVVAQGTDNLTVVSILNNNIGNQDLGGIKLATRNSAEMLANIAGNNLQFNGFGSGDVGGGTANAILPFEHGLEFTAGGNSTLSYELTNNIVNNSFEFALLQTVLANGHINAVWSGNDFTGNDIADDPTTPAPENLGGSFIVNIVGPDATTCLSMTSNAFDAFLFNNGGLATQFELELDGLTNSGLDHVGVGTPHTPRAFGSVCSPNIAAIEGAFTAAGFPPTNH